MSYVGNTPFTAAFLTDTFSGNGSTVAFTMSVAPANTSSIIVAVTGVVQDPSTYSVSGTTLTFSAAPPTGTSNISVRYLGIPASGVTTTAYRTVTDTTATAGQTTFSIPSYTVGYVDVYRNGSRLAGSDYTATSGTSVVLVNAATAGDTITTESFYVSSVLNAFPTTGGTLSGQLTVNSATGQKPLIAQVNGTEVFEVDASGNVGIGTASPSKKLVVSNVGAAGLEIDPFTRSATTGTSLLSYNRSTSAYVRADYDAEQHLFFTGGTERMRVLSTGNILSLSGGSTTATGTGIAFPATQSASTDANTLDDYEEGTWTPVLSQSFVGISSPTVVQGRYIKIGKLLFLTAYFYKSSGATSSSGQWRFEGIPFTLTVGADAAAPAVYMTMNATATTQVARFQANGTNYLDLYGQFATTSWTTSYIEMGFCGVFQTAS
jgi:hypothetical protein